MFYEPDKNDHGLPYNPFKSCVVPRPVGWISTISRLGHVNLAPYSQFNSLGYDPPYVMFSASAHPEDARRKDSVRNAEETCEFVFNMATWDLREAMNTTSRYVGADVDEFEVAGLEAVPSRLVKPPRVAASPVQLECRYHTTLVLPGHRAETAFHVVVGRVVGVHIKDDVITKDGKVDVIKIRPIARMGYLDYTTVDSVFTMPVAEYSPRMAGEGQGAQSKK